MWDSAGMPRWIIWATNLVVIAILSSFAYFLRWTGTEFALGTLFGFFLCYVLYKNWRQDYADEGKPHFTDEPAQRPRQ